MSSFFILHKLPVPSAGLERWSPALSSGELDGVVLDGERILLFSSGLYTESCLMGSNFP